MEFCYSQMRLQMVHKLILLDQVAICGEDSESVQLVVEDSTIVTLEIEY